MPRIETSLGPLDYEDSAVIEFPAGLPGFEQRTRFLLVERPDLRPLVLLQSVDEPALRFLTMPVHVVDPGYHLSVSADDLRVIGVEGAEKLLALAIVCLRDGQPPTANLLGPVVINQAANRGTQAVRNDTIYSAHHLIVKPEAVRC